MKLKKHNIQGSLQDEADRTGQSIEEIISGIDHIVLLDTSSSMDFPIRSKEPGTRFEHACQQLYNLQGKFPGNIMLVTFSTNPRLCLDGKPPRPEGGTNLTDALDMVQSMDGTGINFIVVSDGEPNSPFHALKKGEEFVDPIHTIFIGDPGDMGEDFMRQLATGKSVGRKSPLELEGEITKLLTS